MRRYNLAKVLFKGLLEADAYLSETAKVGLTYGLKHCCYEFEVSACIITHDALARSVDTQRDATANLSGDVVKLPAGEWKAAIGYENRRETAEFRPDSFYTLKVAGQQVGQATATAVSGGYRTNEFYAETLIPIFEPLQVIPALHQLELEGAVRRVNNSIAGDSTTWTKGLRWSPIQDLQFRGNKTRSIRAPAVTPTTRATRTMSLRARRRRPARRTARPRESTPVPSSPTWSTPPLRASPRATSA